MPVRKPLRIRKAVLAGGVALALAGAGTAITWAAADAPPSPSHSESAQGQGTPGQTGKAHKAPGQEKRAKAQRPQHLHSESVVKKADGTFETELAQQGAVDSVSATSITVRSEDGFTRTYAVNADTRIIKFPAPAADGSPARGDDGKRLRPEEVAIGEIAQGEAVRISGVKNGKGITAQQIVEGAGAGPGNGLGLGKGHGKGHGQESDKGHVRGLEK